MKQARLTIALFILLACCACSASSFQVKELHAKASDPSQEARPKNEDFYCPWLYMFYAQKAPPQYGWAMNGTLMQISSANAYKFFNGCANKIYSYNIWQAIPKHPLLMNDPLMMFAHVQPPSSGTLESDTFLIINGTKWPIMGGLNQTSSAGVKAELIVQANQSFLKSYPTGMYITGTH